MKLARRLIANLFTGTWHAKRVFDDSAQATITVAVKRAESLTSAEVRVVVEPALNIASILRGQTARERALEVFGLERVWDTTNNTGILLYVLLSERDAEIVADRGFNNKVTDDKWRKVCQLIEATVPREGLAAALELAVCEIGEIAKESYPILEGDRNELPDEVRVGR